MELFIDYCLANEVYYENGRGAPNRRPSAIERGNRTLLGRANGRQTLRNCRDPGDPKPD